MIEPGIILCAPNGARRTRADHAAIPITPQELAHCAKQIQAEGASMLHLHVRDDSACHSLDVERYRSAIDAVAAQIGNSLVIQITSEAAGKYAADEQMRMIKALKPEAVSIALREVFPSHGRTATERDFARWLIEQGIFFQIILYGTDDIVSFELALRAGLFGTTPPFTLLVAGRYGDSGAVSAAALRAIEARLPSLDFPWALCAFGAAEHDAVELAARHGGHVRVGFENNLNRKDGQPAASNAELVAEARIAFERQGRKIATAEAVRKRFGLSQAKRA